MNYYFCGLTPAKLHKNKTIPIKKKTTGFSTWFAFILFGVTVSLHDFDASLWASLFKFFFFFFSLIVYISYLVFSCNLIPAGNKISIIMAKCMQCDYVNVYFRIINGLQ